MLVPSPSDSSSHGPQGHSPAPTSTATSLVRAPSAAPMPAPMQSFLVETDRVWMLNKMSQASGRAEPRAPAVFPSAVTLSYTTSSNSLTTLDPRPSTLITCHLGGFLFPSLKLPHLPRMVAALSDTHEIRRGRVTNTVVQQARGGGERGWLRDKGPERRSETWRSLGEDRTIRPTADSGQGSRLQLLVQPSCCPPGSGVRGPEQLASGR